jgi:hypothetical protein
MKLKHALCVLSALVFWCGSVPAQSSTRSEADYKVVELPNGLKTHALVTQVTRAQFLKMDETALRNTQVYYEITDVVSQRTAPALDDGKYYLTVDEFNATSNERKVQVLKNPAMYVVVPNGTCKPKTPMKESELNALDPDKREAVLQSGNYYIQR